MSDATTLLLAGGGRRTLLAVATEAARLGADHTRSDDTPLTLLFIHDGRESAPRRQAQTRAMARHFGLRAPVELKLGFELLRAEQQAPLGQAAPLATMQRLVLAMGRALAAGARRLVWPAQCDAEHDAIARVTEQVELVWQLAQLEHDNPPLIDTPLLEISDTQLIELGAQVALPWHLAWDCDRGAERPCDACPGCQRRRKAFEDAGIPDASADKPRAVR